MLPNAGPFAQRVTDLGHGAEQSSRCAQPRRGSRPARAPRARRRRRCRACRRPSAPAPARGVSTVSTPKPHGTPVRSATSCDPARRRRADVVVVVGLAADHRAEAGDAAEAAALRRVAAPPAPARRRPGRRRPRPRRPARLEAPPRAPARAARRDPRRSARRRARSAAISPRRAWRARSRVQHLGVEVEALVVQRVAQLLALGAQVGDVLGVRRLLDRDLVGDRQPVALERVDLLRVVGQDADRAQSPRSTRIWAPMPKSRRSAGSPSRSFASTVSRPSSCSL